MNPDRLRVWAARLAAPLAFFLAATVLVLLVQRGLEQDGDALSNGGTVRTTETAAEPPSETGPDEPPRERQFYRVRAGDTLESIAERFETDVGTLLELNPGIDPLALSPRQRIRVQ